MDLPINVFSTHTPRRMGLVRVLDEVTRMMAALVSRPPSRSPKRCTRTGGS